MNPLVLKHEGKEYHFALVNHALALKNTFSSEIEALVLEENLHICRGGRKVVMDFHKMRKPIYFVENPELVNSAGTSINEATASSFLKVFGGLLISTPAGLALYAKVSKEKLSRRDFIKHLLVSGVALFMGTAYLKTGFELGSKFNLEQKKIFDKARADLKKVTPAFTLEDFNKLPNDVKGGLMLAVRNAVMAEGLHRLSKRHSVLGMMVGTGHYNLTDYILDDEKRKLFRAGFEPVIRRLHPDGRIDRLALK
ncbi:MAG: twin-arginine translocation signal domain-containing protein [Candidatus Micrarchaeota archaeon]